jgi:CDP-paratose 2-epimerase
MGETILVTGGCGFIGCNLVERLLGHGHRVRVLDNLSRKGSEINRAWLLTLPGQERLELIQGDVRDAETARQAVEGVDAIYHFAAQVAVTSSVTTPRHDMEVNVLGTFNVLEAARQSARRPLVLFTSTNKVYGGMEDVGIREEATRYTYADLPQGVDESRPLDFHSPYGCSKGSADQYVHDYQRIYGFPTVVVRMSCIYGIHQFGNEDQGWVAHFLITLLKGGQISIYGDGKQVRDVLYISDLLNLFETILARHQEVAGQIFNIGGGPQNTISVWAEFAPLLKRLLGREIPVVYGPWRPGDQKVYISDPRKAQRLLGWSPQVSVEQGVSQLLAWLRQQGIGA